MTKKTKTAEQVIEEIRKELTTRKSRAAKINELIYKHKEWLRTEIKTKPFKQPCAQLERRSGDVEFYEDVTTGLFEYKHSDGTNRFIIIVPSRQKKFGMTHNAFKGYWLHEDYPLPLPQDPFITTEQLNISIEQALSDIKQWKAKEIKARGDMWWKIALGIAAIILAYGIIRVLIPSAPTETLVKPVTQAAANGATTVIP